MLRAGLALGLLALSGCNVVAVGGAVGVLSAGAAVAYDCPSYVSVSLRDDLTGQELCGEEVVARDRQGGRERSLTTCATQRLPEGRWELRAERGGEASVLELAPVRGCERFVHSVELTLPAPGHFAPGS
ncbi:MAG: hypothetical protein HYZ29_27295 [Myxococcales bacterium]|nr:hypothetical protein [Myxococcales bacterium]